ncbi:hypothetical protein BWQ96_10346 [Gracilariopsis chorda]|uniref:Uncharacterized protein n=1 Tax=Gracilariopsis chorda TaxID=448386 RepID=A0A2V3ICX4_9FLOR|nr:hypothetical protein BWQ96_10346 [Gracilariopsis chorda]|eukprot:PXF39945.1 hypothetical protein BWQ96_10346 [Gracilariopsis chorda]
MDQSSVPTHVPPPPHHPASHQQHSPTTHTLSDHPQTQPPHHKPAPPHPDEQPHRTDTPPNHSVQHVVVNPDQTTAHPPPSHTQVTQHSNLLNSSPHTAAPNVVQPDAQRIVTSTHLPTHPDVVTSSQLIAPSVSTSAPHQIPSSNDIAAQTLKAATEAASAAVKDELAFGPSSTAYHHANQDALKHPQSQSTPDQNFSDMPHIDSAAMLNNVINDETHQTLPPQHPSGNMLHAFPEHTDPSTLNTTNSAQHIVTAPHTTYQNAQQPAHSQPHSAFDPTHAHQQLVNNTSQQQPIHVETPRATTQIDRFPHTVIQPAPQIARSAAPLQVPTRITNPVVSAALNGTLPKKPARMPGTKQCPTCHSTIAAALAKCTKCQHVFREKKEKVKRSGKRGKKNCPKCSFENPSACSSCKQCKYVFRLKLMERYKQMRPRQNAATAAAAAAAAAAHVTSSLPLVQSSNALAVTTVPLPAGVASYPGHIAPAIASPHSVAVLPPFSQNQITIHPHTHNVHTSGVSQVHPIPQHPVQHHQPHPQL